MFERRPKRSTDARGASQAQPRPEGLTSAATLGGGSRGLSLESLDRQSIAVELNTPAGRKLVLGMGQYRTDPDLGPVLQIAVSDERASYDLLLVEGEWAGTIEPGAAYGCDFLLRIG